MSRVRFMGRINGQAWWDIEATTGWVVVKAGRWKRGGKFSLRDLRWPRVYWSPNATPWHHDARSLFRAAFVKRQECVCDLCHDRTPAPINKEGNDAV